MSYVDHVLQPGENLKHRTTVHWMVFFPGLFLLLIAIIVAANTGATSDPGLNRYIMIAALLIAGIALLSLLRAWFRRWTTEIAVTDKRVIFKSGFISRSTIEMNMDKVESVDVAQSILGRIFDYGTIVVRGTGASMEPLRNVQGPIELRNSIMVH